MKTMTWLSLSFAFLVTGSGCTDKTDATPAGETCDNERLLETYHDHEAMVIKAGGYCLTVAPEALQTGLYNFQDVLVTLTPLPAAYQVEGLRVRISGRKKSCYGLTTLPNLRTTFGYKLELDEITTMSGTGR